MLNRYYIDLLQIQKNISLIRSLLPSNTRVMVMVKSNAYGVGDVELCRWLPHCGVSIAGVANVYEATRLRSLGVSIDLFVFHANEEEISALLRTGAAVGVSSLSFVEALAREACPSSEDPIRVHLHLDTGMTRFGASMEEALAIVRFVDRTPVLTLSGLMSHFPCADQPWNDRLSEKQIEQLLVCKKRIAEEKLVGPRWTHIANSAGALRFSLPECNMVRLGIEAYGIRPSSGYPRTDTRCALTLQTTLLQVTDHPEGTGVSYGHIDRLRRPSKVGVLPLGYFDGLHRKYHKSSILIQGKRVPILGNITMDYTMVDVTDVAAEAGMPVTIFGYDEEKNFADPITFAEESGTIAHELITCLGPRIPRIYQS